MTDPQDLQARVDLGSRQLRDVVTAVGTVIVAQRPLIEEMLLGLLCGGHLLFEGMPGLAKSLMVRTLARAFRADFRRVQFTPDLLPADLTGTQVYNPQEGTFSIRQGPIFANIILADEINRAPPKVQSALLEAMQEGQVTLAGETRKLPEPFIVLATQNPIEQEGTYPLPEAQIDRFLMKAQVTYTGREEEKEIVQRQLSPDSNPQIKNPLIDPVMGLETLLGLKTLVREIVVDEKIVDYAVNLVQATRDPAAAGLDDLAGLVQYGASPRASIALVLVARAAALLDGRGFVLPRDVKRAAPDVLRHRLILSYEAEAEEVDGAEIIRRILDQIEVP